MDGNAKIKSFKDLIIWQKGIELVEVIYKVTRHFPKEETYGLTSQLKRAAISIPSNVAEGFGRYHSKEYRNFLFISMGSCAELITQVIIAERLGFIDESKTEDILERTEQLSKMTRSLIKKVETKC